MGSKNKLKRFNENDTFQNVIQPTREEVVNQFEHQGKWHQFFGNNNPIVVELGCGKGEYTVGLAAKNPDKNYIGIDVKGARFWRGAKTATENEYKNVAFVRTQIELVDFVFDNQEISEIWITFPDPQIKYKRTKHRMTNPVFLDKYKKILKPNGLVHLKTDSEFMHGYSIGLLQGLDIKINYANHDIYKNEGAPDEVLNIKTFYENQYLAKNKAITYLQFSL